MRGFRTECPTKVLVIECGWKPPRSAGYRQTRGNPGRRARAGSVVGFRV